MGKKSLQNKQEASLIAKAQQGCQHALNGLIASVYLRLLHCAYPLTNSKDEAKDIVQETMIKIYHNIAQFKGESSFYTWAFRIVRNTALDQIAKDKRRPPQQDIDVHLNLSEQHSRLQETDNPENLLEQAEINAKLQVAYQELPAELKNILKLRELGMPYDKMAEKLRKPIGTIRSRLSRARKLLMHKVLGNSRLQPN